MTFLILTHVLHKEFGGKYFAYGPYVREMNIWIKYADKIIIAGPSDKSNTPTAIDLAYDHTSIDFIQIPEFNIQGFHSIVRTIYLLPVLLSRISKGMKLADHIHLRCPGNVGLIGCFVQIFFPNKKKTAKYAGNWDWDSSQPWSYRMQQRILRNTFFTRKMNALVYGEWPDKTRNIKPFFAASFSETEKLHVIKKPLEQGIKIAFVGGLTKNKNPLLSVEVLKTLTDKNINAKLTFCGEGPERSKIEETGYDFNLRDKVKLLGNVDAETVKEILRESHFLVLISKSEGWPKAVAEAMWWGCLPITTDVSCVSQILGNGSRGNIVSGDVNEISEIINHYLSSPESYRDKCEKAMDWSRNYTLEKFEEEVGKLLCNPIN